MTLFFATVNEPPKAEVLAWRRGDTFRREAFVHLVNDSTGYEAVVDLATRTLLRFDVVSETSYHGGVRRRGPGVLDP